MANILQQIGTTVKSKLDTKVDKTDAVTDFLKSILGFPQDTDGEFFSATVADHLREMRETHHWATIDSLDIVTGFES